MFGKEGKVMTLIMWLLLAAIWWYLGRLAVWFLVRKDGPEGLRRHWIDLNVSWTDDPCIILGDQPECPAPYGTDMYWRYRGSYWMARAERETERWFRTIAPMFGPFIFIRLLRE